MCLPDKYISPKVLNYFPKVGRKIVHAVFDSGAGSYLDKN